MRIREVVESDFEMIAEWLIKWKLTPIERRMYSTDGYIIEDDDGNPLYSGFIWRSNSAMAMIGFVTRNPFVKIKNKQTLKTFINELLLLCIEFGYEYVITWAESPFLVNEFKSFGMKETSNKCSELILKMKI